MGRISVSAVVALLAASFVSYILAVGTTAAKAHLYAILDAILRAT